MCSNVEALSRMTAALVDLGELEVGLGSGSGADYLALRALADRLEVVGLRWLAALDAAGVGTVDGSASTAAWVRRHTGCSARTAASDVRLSRRLHTDGERRLATTARLLDEGRLTVEHAGAIARTTATMTPAAFAMAEPVIADAIGPLPVDPAAQVAAQVARHTEQLHADDHDDPVAARRAAAEAGRHLRLSPCGDLYALDGLLTAEAGQALQSVLAPLWQPRPEPDGSPDARTAAQRRADALGEAARLLLATDRLPVHGGQRPQVTVLVDLDTLLTGHGEGCFPDGTPLAAADVERIGCDARVGWLATRSPAAAPCDARPGAPDRARDTAPDDATALVRQALRRISPALGGLPAQVLDAGRSQRLVTPGQRHALAVGDRGCTFPGCDRPPEWCDAHHLVHWSEGGPTDLDNMILLCARHHTTVHDGWQLSRAPDGTVTARPPGDCDVLAAAA